MALKFLNDGYFAGKVGIGIESPLELLHLESTEPLIRFDDTNSGLHYIIGQDGDGFKFTTNNSTSGKYTFDSNVGIGTTGPEGKLNIETNAESNVPALGANTTFLKISNTGGAYGAMIGQLGTGNSYIQSQRFDGTATAYNLLLQPNGGNVGIGSTSPTEKLQVYESGLTAYKSYTTTNAGAILTGYQSTFSPFTKTTDLVAASDGTVPSEIRFLTRTSGTSTVDERMRIDSVGNVGIGVTAPGHKLQVSTPALVSGSTYSWPFDLTRVGSTSRGFSIGVGVAGGNVALGNHNGDMALGQT